MTANRFCRYELRTTDVSAARAFYADVIGPEVWGTDVSLVPLPERAAARGAPAHWLGQIGVHDLEGTTQRLIAAGAEQLGPSRRNPDGSAQIVLRDPFGVVMAVSSEVTTTSAAIAWHVMHTEDHVRAFALYAALFGWTATETRDLGAQHGRHQLFAWDGSGASVGSIADTARSPATHRHWLFCFRVTDLEAASGKVRAHGGSALPPAQTERGDIVSGCDDPQGAAFGLYQFAR